MARTLLLVLSFFLLQGLSAKNLPQPTGNLVSDYIGLLNEGERSAIEKKLVAYNDSTSTQIAVVIEKSLDGDEIFEYSYRLAEQWGIGQKGKGNGVLLYIAFDDRKLRIQTGSGAEVFLTDAFSKRIIETVIVPAFRQEQYYRGLDEATNIIMKLGSGEFTAEDMMNANQIDSRAINVILWLILLIILIIIFAIVYCKRTGKCKETGGGYHDRGRYTTRGGWGGFGGGGFGGSSGGGFSGGGGGFGGFGGGGFSGGGAGGGW